MLRELSIRSFALIDTLDLTFGPGLTALVGETGAGKSILVDALSAALGSRMSADIVRSGDRKAVIEARFDPIQDASLQALLQEHDLQWEEPVLIVRREISASGTSRCFVNDTPTTVSTVRSIAEHVMDFHGQHDTYGLMDSVRHRGIVDEVASADDDLAQMKRLWTDLRSAQQTLESLEQRAHSAATERERIDHALQDLLSLNPMPHEDQEISDTLRRAESREAILTTASSAYDVLYAGTHSAHSALVQAITHLEHLRAYAPELQSLIDELQSAATSCKEGGMAVSSFLDADDLNPEELERLRQRYRALQQLVRTYGSLDEAIHASKRLQEERAQLETIDDDLDVARRTCDRALESAQVQAERLRERRRKAAKPLTKQLMSTLAKVGMPAARVDVQISPTALGPYGADHVEFLFSANAGEQLRPLSDVASGGELSRFMLALKKAQTAKGAASLVFDEIDTGISGSVARKVGEEMRALADRHQVICISHLPQIASLATAMIRVQKDDAGGRAVITASLVQESDMVVEVARLLSGVHITDAAIQSARELMVVSPKES